MFPLKYHVLAATVFAATTLSAEQTALPDTPPTPKAQLGSALSLSQIKLEAHVRPRVAKSWSPGTEGAITGLAVDASKRDEVVAFFHCIFTPSEDFESGHGWTGNLATCSAGTVSQDLHDDTLRRINYYRALAGLNGDISFNASKNADCQEAALMMASNGALSHSPPTNWSCYTAAGAGAAGASNISLGFNFPNYGVRAIDGQMEDDGANNTPVGHRRWLLYSRAQEMGHGSVPLTAASNNRAAASIWVIGDFNPSPPAGLAMIAWPPEGHVPHQTVWPRWSFGLPNGSAGFGSASVTMTKGAVSIPVTIIHRGTGGVGDPTIVWEPSGANYPDYPAAVPSDDTTYTITVSGISGNAQTSYTYNVTVINPDDPGDLSLTGPGAPPTNSISTYSFTPIDSAQSYETKISEVVSANWLEGAETGTMDAIVDQTTPGYALQAGSPNRTGTKSFHLAFDELTDQGFEVCRPIIPTASSQLVFHNLRRWSTTTSVLSAEVSANGGATWDELWSRAGNGSTSSGDWDASFQSVSESLAVYAGQVLKLRFIYRHLGGSYFPGAGSGLGFYLDDIEVTNSETLSNETTAVLPGGASSFEFTPDGPNKQYFLQLRPVFDCVDFGFGEALAVTSTQGPTGMLKLVEVAEFGANIDFRFEVTAGSFASLTLDRSGDLIGWAEDLTATLIDHGGGVYTFRTTPPVGQDRMFYRVAAQ